MRLNQKPKSFAKRNKAFERAKKQRSRKFQELKRMHGDDI